MNYLLTFIFGVVVSFIFLDTYNGDILDLFETAYNAGKQDGYTLGRNDATLEDFSYEQLEAKCKFLYDHK